ncbi:MAG: hypothetical protein Q4Q20_05220 [Methanocorpusculum sp.]|nr:hypothetical protein [Methanocorpusculum sp.]
MSLPQGIPNCSPANLLFAWELARASGSPVPGSPKNPQFSTPFGTFTGPVALCGTLTEKEVSDGNASALRVSDPTGICIIHIDERDIGLRKQAGGLEEPCFVYVLGKLRNPRRNDKPPAIYAEAVVKVSRTARDSWIANTAEHAVIRLPECPDDALKHEFASQISAALSAVVSQQSREKRAVSLSDDEILSLVRSLYEGKAAGKAKVINALTGKGFTREEAESRIRTLMGQGDLYAPRPDILKVL